MRVNSSRVPFVLLVLLVATAAGARAQARRELASGHAQAQLMGYFAAVMGFTPVGQLGDGERWAVGGALTFIPALSTHDRAVGFGGTKAEDANLCPVYPRLTAVRRFGNVTAEAGWTPPVRVCGVRANVSALALSYGVPLALGWGAALRASAVVGTLDAAITCSEAATRDSADQTCFGGAPSRDRVLPRTGQLDAVLSYAGTRRGGPTAYLLVGVRRERVTVDVSYVRPAGGPFPPLDDDQGLATTLTRLHAGLGASAPMGGRLRLGGELYAAPGALVTVRGSATLALGGGR